jgi:hypothetical protein
VAALDVRFDPDRLELTIEGKPGARVSGLPWPIPARAVKVDPRVHR